MLYKIILFITIKYNNKKSIEHFNALKSKD